MPKQVRFQGVVHTFPDDATEDEIRAALASQPAPSPGGRVGGPGGGGQPPSALQQRQAPPRSWTDTAVDALPSVGATAGGLIGGSGGAAFGLGFGGVPGAVGGAALGGAAGESARQLVNRVRGKEAPTTSLEAATDIGTEAAWQGAGELVGAGAGAGFRALAPRIAAVGLAPVESVARKVSRTDLGRRFVGEGKFFNDRFQRGGIGTLGAEGSGKQAAGLAGESRQELLDTLRAADLAGTPGVSSRQVVQGLAPLVEKARIAAQLGNKDRRNQVLQHGQQFLNRNPAVIPNETAAVLLKEADDLADAAHVAARTKGPKADLTAQMNKAVGNELRQGIRTNVPKSQDISTRTRELMQLSKALDKDAVRNHLLTRSLAQNTLVGLGGLGLGGGVGYGASDRNTFGGATGALLGSAGALYAMQNPAMLGRLALSSDAVGRGLRYSPAAARALIEALENQRDEEPTP